MPVGAAIAASAVLGYMGSQDASKAASEANAQNIAFQRENSAANRAFQEKWNMLNDPFSGTGQRQQYVGQLNDFMNNPAGVAGMYNDPTFMAQLNMGNEAISRRMAASGNAGSGAEMFDLGQYSMGFARDAYNERLKTLMSLSGASGGGNLRGQDQQAAQGMDPSTAYNMAAAPWQVGSTAISTLGGIYGRTGGGKSTTVLPGDSAPGWFTGH